jgi:hypothetical protein
MGEALQMLDQNGPAAAQQSEPVTVWRAAEDLLAAREQWSAVPWRTFEADLDVFLAVVDARPEAIRPHVIAVERDGRVAAALVLRLERVPLSTSVGYATLYSPRVRSLTLVHGGEYAEDAEAARLVLDELERSLGRGEADVAQFPSLPVDSLFFGLANSRWSRARRQHFAESRPHHRMTLPESVDVLLAGRSRKTRYNLKRSADMLEGAVPDLSLELLRDPADFELIMRNLERVAAKTYQRALGAGFADVEYQRRLVRLALERGWLRAWLLRDGNEPIAFWLGFVHRRTFFSSSTGYDPAYAKHGLGTYLHLRLLRDLCADPAVDALDYGLGDADYKRRFADTTWLESDALIYAPRPRGMQVSLARNGILLADRLARRTLERFGLTQRVKRLWRTRLRRAKP